MKRSARLATLVGAILTLALSGVSAVSASAAPARVATSSPPFNATITAPSLVLQGCCFTGIGLAPIVVTVPRIGRATVSGSIIRCGSLCLPDGRGTTLSLVFTTPSGDTLTLGGFSPFTSPLTWAVVGGTGRFADASGSGQYTFDVAFPLTGAVTTVTLSGTLRLNQ